MDTFVVTDSKNNQAVSASLSNRDMVLTATLDRQWNLWYVSGDPTFCAHWLENLGAAKLYEQLVELRSAIKAKIGVI